MSLQGELERVIGDMSEEAAKKVLHDTFLILYNNNYTKEEAFDQFVAVYNDYFEEIIKYEN